METMAVNTGDRRQVCKHVEFPPDSESFVSYPRYID